MIDKTIAKNIQAECELALQKVAEKYGVTISGHGGTISENEFIMKLKVEQANVKKQYSETTFSILGLPTDIIGRTFVSNGLTHTITEISKRAPKYPIITQASNGKSYKFTVDSIKKSLKL